MLTTMSCRQALETEGLPSDKRLPGIAERSIKMDGRRPVARRVQGGQKKQKMARGAGEKKQKMKGGVRGPGALEQKKQKMDGVVSWSSNSDKLPEILIPGAICSLTTGFLEHGNAGLTWHGGVGGLWNDKKLGFDGDAELLGHTGSQHGAFMHL